MINLKKLLFLIFIFIISLGIVSAANETQILQETQSEEPQEIQTEEIITEPSQEIQTEEILTEPSQDIHKEETLTQTNDDELASTVKFSGTAVKDLETKIQSLSSGDTLELEKDVSSTEDYNSIYVDVENIVIDGKNHKIDGSNKNTQIYVTSKYVTLKNINFINFVSEYGFTIRNAEHFSFINCNFTNNNCQNLIWLTQSDSSSLNSCNFNGNTITKTFIVWWQGYGSSITNCNFYNNFNEIGRIDAELNFDIKAGTISGCNFNNLRLRITSDSSKLISSNFYKAGVLWSGKLGNLNTCNFTDCGTAVNWRGESGILSTSNFKSKVVARILLWDGNKGTLYGCNFIDTSASEDFIKWEGSEGEVLTSLFPSSDKPYINSVYSDIKVQNNWFSNTMDDYNITPSVTGFNLTNWLVLDLNCTGNMSVLSLNNKYDALTKSFSKLSRYNLPACTFTLSSINADLSTDKLTITTGSDSFRYTLTGSHATITVSCAGLELTRVFDTEWYSLQKLIDEAQGQITLSQNYTHDGKLDGSNPIVINKSLTVDGGGYSINALFMSQIFKIESDNVVLKNINFLKGYGALGGAIFSSGENITVMDCNFTDNRVAIKGGGIYFNGGSNIRVIRSMFNSNRATNGGAISVFNVTDCLIDNCIFNEGIASYGAEIHDEKSSTTINNCRITNSYQYVISSQNSILTTVVNNTIETNGNPGIYVFKDSNAFLENNIMDGQIVVLGQILSNTAVIVLNNQTLTAPYKSRINMTAVLKDDRNNTIKHNNLTFVLSNGARLGPDLYSDGVFSYEIEFDKSGTYVISAETDLINTTIFTADVIVGDEFDLKINLSPEINYQETAVLNITAPADATNNITVLIDSNVFLSMKVSDSFISIPIANLTGGNHTVEVVYPGDDRYLANSASQNITVNRILPFMVVVISENINHGEDAVVNVTLESDAVGIIAISLNGKVINSSSLNNGYASIILANMQAGSHALEVNYSGDNNYNGDVKTYVLNINRIAPVMNVSVATTSYYAEPVKVIVNLNNDAGGNIILSLNGKVISNSTIKNGFLSTSVNNLLLGKNTLEILYSGDVNYYSVSQSFNIKVSKLSTKLMLKSKFKVLASDVKAKEKGSVITGVLKDAKGKVIASEKVSVKLNSKVYNVKTDKNGKFRLIVTLANAKTYNVKFSYAGSQKYLASSKTSKIVVLKKKTKIKAKSKKFRKNKVKKLKVRLVTVKNPSNGKKYLKKSIKMTLKVKGKTFKAKTNKKGYATFKIKLSKIGKYTAVIKFKGDKTYKKSAKKIKIKIK